MQLPKIFKTKIEWNHKLQASENICLGILFSSIFIQISTLLLRDERFELNLLSSFCIFLFLLLSVQKNNKQIQAAQAFLISNSDWWRVYFPLYFVFSLMIQSFFILKLFIFNFDLDLISSSPGLIWQFFENMSYLLGNIIFAAILAMLRLWFQYRNLDQEIESILMKPYSVDTEIVDTDRVVSVSSLTPEQQNLIVRPLDFTKVLRLPTLLQSSTAYLEDSLQEKNQLEMFFESESKPQEEFSLQEVSSKNLIELLSQLMSEKRNYHKDSKDLTLSLQIPKIHENTCLVRCDLEKLKLILSQLIDESIRSLGLAKGRVRMQLDYSAYQANLVLEDNGRGVGEELPENSENLKLMDIYGITRAWGAQLEVATRLGVGRRICIRFPLILDTLNGVNASNLSRSPEAIQNP